MRLFRTAKPQDDRQGIEQKLAACRVEIDGLEADVRTASLQAVLSGDLTAADPAIDLLAQARRKLTLLNDAMQQAEEVEQDRQREFERLPTSARSVLWPNMPA